MSTSRFWKFAAVLLIGALLYIGHGLHRLAGAPSWSLTEPCAAQETIKVATATRGAKSVLVSQNADGTVLHLWSLHIGDRLVEADRQFLPRYLGSVDKGNQPPAAGANVRP